MTITVITGANSGVGLGAALALAKQGHELILLVRSQSKADQTRERILGEVTDASVHFYLMDLENLASIKLAAEQIKSDFTKLDVLINNAGVILTGLEHTDIGMEKTLAVNHLGHFLFTDLLLPLLLESDRPRVINTSSGAHFGGSFDFDDLNYEEKRFGSMGFPAYSRSKLANVLFTKALHRRGVGKLEVFAIHPGFVGSNFAKNNGFLAKIAMVMLKPFARSIHRGAAPLIYLATAENLSDESGEYFQDSNSLPFSSPKIKSVASSRNSYNEQLQEQLWKVSIEYLQRWDPTYKVKMDQLSAPMTP